MLRKRKYKIEKKNTLDKSYLADERRESEAFEGGRRGERERE